MFPAATAAPFARNVACRGIFVIYFSVFKIYYVLLSFLLLYYDIKTRSGSDTPVCHEGAMVLFTITIISTFYCGLLRSDAVSYVLTKA